jgi:flagellar protein FliO/FliZ
MINADAGSVSWLQIVLAFAVVAALLAFFGFALRYFKMRGFTMPGVAPAARRLQIIETLLIDPRRRLVIVRCDAAEHLLLLGVNEDVVIEANLAKTPVPLQTKSGA